jgi:hypothetical protein
MSEPKGMYYTPKEVIDPAVGTGNYLNTAADMLANPPYSAQQSVQADGAFSHCVNCPMRGDEEQCVNCGAFQTQPRR